MPSLLIGPVRRTLLAIRRTFLAMAGANALLAASPAAATPLLDFVFTETSGLGLSGGPTIGAAPGDVVTVELRLTAGAEGVSSYAVSVEFDRDLRDELDLVSVEEILPAGFAFAFTPGELAEQRDSDGTRSGRLYTFEAATLGLGPVSRTVTIGRVEFLVGEVLTDGPDLEVGFFNLGVDGLFDNAGEDVAGSASLGFAAVEAIPEPALPLLLLLAAPLAFERSRGRLPGGQRSVGRFASRTPR